MTTELQGIKFATHIANGRQDDSASRWLQNGFAAWLRCGGALPLHQCLALPSTESKLKRSKRDQWIVVAAALIDARNDWAAANELAIELDRFITRGPWRAWRDANAVPHDASRLRAALFHIAVSNGGKSLSTRQFQRVIGHR